MKLKFLQKTIDVLRGKRKTKFNFWVEGLKRQKQYNKIIKNIKRKAQNGEKIKVCFSVVFDSVFPAENIYKEMLKDDLFEPFILVIPDVVRGEENKWYQLEKTVLTLSKRYQNVCCAYNYEIKEFEDYSKEADIFFFANPYDQMTDKMYSVEYLSQNVLTAYVPYGYSGLLNYSMSVFKMKEYTYFWKIYTETQTISKMIKQFQNIKVNNLEVVGYPKMDCLSDMNIEKSTNPLIIISPHHTVRDIKGYLNISNFLNLADFYIELFEKYSNVDFIFRPHPLLFVTLSQDDMWGKQKVEEYITKLTNSPNVKYEAGGEYFTSFKKSWAIINDCGSFLAEYFYFDKPQCYILQNESKTIEQFTSFGQELLKHTYNAYTEKDIIDFIDNVVLKQNDFKQEERIDFAQKEVMLNYPNVTNKIIKTLKEELK